MLIINLKKQYKNIKKNITGVDPSDKYINYNTIFINESALYEVLSISTKPLAKIFMNKYFVDIMPQIRKTGNYISNKNDLKKIKVLNNKLDNYKKELNYYDDKYNFEPSTFGYLYINENNQIKRGIKHKCFKVGFTLDMKKRVKEYKVGNFKHKLLAYIPLKIDRKQIEKCVKTRLKPHLTKIITDTVCYVSLTELKKEIIDCINFTNKHICHCVKCSKMYNLSTINKHKCNLLKTSDIINYSKKSKNNSKISKLSKLSKTSKLSKISKLSKTSKLFKTSKLSKISKLYKH